MPEEEKGAFIEVVARRAPVLFERKMFKEAISAPDDDNQLIISSSSEDDDVKNGQRIKTKEDDLVEVKAQLSHLTARYYARKEKLEKER